MNREKEDTAADETRPRSQSSCRPAVQRLRQTVVAVPPGAIVSVALRKMAARSLVNCADRRRTGKSVQCQREPIAQFRIYAAPTMDYRSRTPGSQTRSRA